LASIWSTADAQILEPTGIPCGVRTNVIQQLADQYGETQREVGLAPKNGVVVELFASGDGQTWTILVSLPNGRACLLANGTDWQITGHAVLRPGPGQGS
jgi:hypothetical protein